MDATPDRGALLRRLGLADAVFVGLGSMLGAGVFAAFGPAAAAAGSGLLLAVAVAGVVAAANAWSSARLAARVVGPARRALPGVGGHLRLRSPPARARVGVHGRVGVRRRQDGVVRGDGVDGGGLRLARAPTPGRRAVVVALTLVNGLGVGKTARVTRILVILTLTALAVVVAGAATGPRAGLAQPWDWFPQGPLGVLRAAGLLFFAFAGYARIATLGEEVRDPARTIPRAIPLALGLVLTVYLLVGTAALVAVGPDALAASPPPLATAVGGRGPLVAVVRVGGAVAAAGVLLSLLAGVGRTTLAMARDRELPHLLVAVSPRRQVPHRAQLAVGAVVVVLVLLTDLRDVIGFSGVAVLVYYAIANACALTLGPRGGWSWTVALGGLAGCIVLAVTLPAVTAVTGVAVLATGLVGRAVLRRRSPAPG